MFAAKVGRPIGLLHSVVGQGFCSAFEGAANRVVNSMADAVLQRQVAA